MDMRRAPALTTPYLPAGTRMQMRYNNGGGGNLSSIPSGRQHPRQRQHLTPQMIEAPYLRVTERFWEHYAKTTFGEMWRGLVLFYEVYMRNKQAYVTSLYALKNNDRVAVDNNPFSVQSWNDVLALEAWVTSAHRLLSNPREQYDELPERARFCALFRFLLLGLTMARMRYAYGDKVNPDRERVHATSPSAEFGTVFSYPKAQIGGCLPLLVPDYFQAMNAFRNQVARVLHHTHCCLCRDEHNSQLLGRMLEAIADLKEIRCGRQDQDTESFTKSVLCMFVVAASMTSVVVGRSAYTKSFLHARKLMHSLGNDANVLLRERAIPHHLRMKLANAYPSVSKRTGLRYDEVIRYVLDSFSFLVDERAGAFQHPEMRGVSKKLLRMSDTLAELSRWHDKMEEEVRNMNVPFTEHFEDGAQCFDELLCNMLRHNGSVVDVCSRRLQRTGATALVPQEPRHVTPSRSTPTAKPPSPRRERRRARKRSAPMTKAGAKYDGPRKDMTPYVRLTDFALELANDFLKRAVRTHTAFDGKKLPHEKVRKDAVKDVKKAMVAALRTYYDASNKRTFIGAGRFGVDCSPVVSLKVNGDGTPARRNCVYVRRVALADLKRALAHDSTDPPRHKKMVSSVWSALHAACRYNMEEQGVMLNADEPVYRARVDDDGGESDEKEDAPADEDTFQSTYREMMRSVGLPKVSLNGSDDSSTIPYSAGISAMVEAANVDLSDIDGDDAREGDTASDGSTAPQRTRKRRRVVVSSSDNDDDDEGDDAPEEAPELPMTKHARNRSITSNPEPAAESEDFRCERWTLADGVKISWREWTRCVRDATQHHVRSAVREAVTWADERLKTKVLHGGFCVHRVAEDKLVPQEVGACTSYACMMQPSEERQLKHEAYETDGTLLIRSGVYMSIDNEHHVPLYAAVSVCNHGHYDDNDDDDDDDPLYYITSASLAHRERVILKDVFWWYDPQRGWAARQNDLKRMLAVATKNRVRRMQLLAWVSQFYRRTRDGADELVRLADADAVGDDMASLHVCHEAGCHEMVRMQCHGVDIDNNTSAHPVPVCDAHQAHCKEPGCHVVACRRMCFNGNARQQALQPAMSCRKHFYV